MSICIIFHLEDRQKIFEREGTKFSYGIKYKKERLNWRVRQKVINYF